MEQLKSKPPKVTRKQLHNKIEKLSKKIEAMQKHLIQLKIEELKFSDKNRWYKEKVVSTKNGNQLLGSIYWNEPYTDEGTGETIVIERSMAVRFNNDWPSLW